MPLFHPIQKASTKLSQWGSDMFHNNKVYLKYRISIGWNSENNHANQFLTTRNYHTCQGKKRIRGYENEVDNLNVVEQTHNTSSRQNLSQPANRMSQKMYSTASRMLEAIKLKYYIIFTHLKLQKNEAFYTKNGVISSFVVILVSFIDWYSFLEK